MKKLMTLLGITAFALGAFADLPSGTSFESYPTGEFDYTTDDGGSGSSSKYWATAQEGVEASVVLYDGDGYSCARPAQFNDDESNNNYLKIDTTPSTLYRAMNPITGDLAPSSIVGSPIGDGLYIDTMVQFTVSGDPRTEEPEAGTKLAIWAETDDSVDNSPTNFVVWAGYGADNTPTNYTMVTPANFVWGDWHRLTLKAIANIGNGKPGFVIFVDTKPLLRANPSGIGFEPGNKVDAEFVQAVLPSMVASGDYMGTLAAIGFNGDGKVDDISFTDVAPDFAADASFYQAVKGAGVSSVVCGEYPLNEIPLSEGTIVVTYAEGYSPRAPQVSSGSSATVTPSAPVGNVVTYTVTGVAAGDVITFSGFQPVVTVDVAGTVTPYETIGAAFDAVVQSGGTVALVSDVQVETGKGLSIDDNVNVVLDLAGHKITGAYGDYVLAVNAGTLVVTNSTVAVGEIDVGDGDGVWVSEGGLTKIYGGKFTGLFDAEGYKGESVKDIIAIYGGQFDTESWAKEDLVDVAEDDVYGPSDGYYTVGGEVPPTPVSYIVTYYTNGVKYAEATYTLNDASSFTPPTDPVIAGYDFDGWYTDNGTFDTEFVFDATKDSDTSVYAKLTAKSMVIRIVKADTTTEDYPSVADALKDAGDGDTLVLLADCSDDIELPTGVAFDTDEYEYSGDVTAADGNGYEVVENGGVYTIVDNTTSTWNGLAGDGLWGTAGNWSKGVVPTQYTTVTFGGDADVGIGAEDDVRMVAGLVLNGNVSLHHNTRNYSYWPSVKICGGDVTGTGTLTLERCGFVGDGSATINVACPVVFKGDSPANHDCFLRNGPIVFNGSVSSTTGRLHLQTPVTFNGAVNLTNATITSAITGGSAPTFNGAVTLENGASILTYSFTYNDALTIGKGAVVSIGSTTQNYGENFTMTGSGRFIGNTVLPTGKAKEALTQSTWTGTFELLNKTVTDHWWISDYGNAKSKVCFNNVTTYLYNDGAAAGKDHMVAGIEVGSGGFKINGSYSKAYSWSLPALSGTGTFTVGIAGGTAGSHDKNVYLPADCSEFSGNIAFASDAANTRLVFGATERAFKEKTICVGSDAVVGAGATWTASDEIYLDGIVKASANTSLSTVVGSGKIVYGAKPTGTHVFGEGWSGIGAIDYKGDDRIDLADYVNTIAQKCSCDTVEVVKGCTMSLENYFGADVTPTLKVSGFVTINDGSSTTKRTVSNITGDGVLVFGTKGAMVNYAIDNVVGWNGVITNSASSTLVTNLVSGAGTVVYNVAASTTIGADFGGEVEYAVAPSAAPVVNAESEATVYLNFNYAGMNIAPYGNAKSTIKLGNLSADNAYLNDGEGSGTGRIPSKVIVAGDVTINNGWTQYPSFDWTASKTLQFNEFTVDGSFVLLSTRNWNDAQCYYYIKSLNGDGAGSITVGAGYSLRIDAVDFAEAPSGDDCVPLTVGAATATAAAGNLYGADGVLNGTIPVTVNGVATEQSLVYDAEKGGLVLYVPPAQVTIGIPTVENTTPSVTADGEPVEIVNGQITVTDGAAIVLTYTSTTHEVTNGTIEFTAADGYTVDASGVTTAQYVAKIDGGASYTTLQAAFDAAANSQKIVLLANEVAGVTLPSVGKMVYFYAGSFTSGEIADAEGNFITTVTDETTTIGGENVMAKKYRVEAAFMAVTISDTRTLYGSSTINDASATANAGPLGTTVEFFSGDPASYAAYLPMFTYNEQTGIYTKTLEPVAAVYSSVQQVSVHTSLADAIAAAEDGLTVKLLANVTLDARVNVAKSVTIDLAGYSITRTAAPNGDNGSAFRVDGAYTVTIKGGAIDCSGVDDATVLKDGVFAIDAKNGATLSLTNLTVTVDSKNGACVYAWSGSTVTILDGTYANTTQEYYQYGKFQEAKGMAVNQANVATQLLTIYGGSFKQIDPSLGDDSESGCSTFLASGYAATWNSSTGYYDVAEVQEVPVVPGQQTVPVDTPAAAAEIAGKTVVSIDQDVAAELTTEQQTAYKDLFEAKVVEVKDGGDTKYAVAVELKDEVATDLQADVDGEAEDLAAAAVAAAANPSAGGTADVATVAGLYYIVEAGTGINNIVPVSCTLATGEATELTVPNKGTSGFYRLRVSVTPVDIPNE